MSCLYARLRPVGQRQRVSEPFRNIRLLLMVIMNTSTQQGLTLAFIGGGNMASALAAGLIGKRCGAHDVLVIDPQADTRERWAQQGVQVAPEAGEALAAKRIWVFAVKPQVMKAVVAACRPYLTPDTLVVSVAAGIPGSAISQWLTDENGRPHERVVRCMPNTPALIGAGASGLLALGGVSDADRDAVQQLFKATGETTWVQSDADIDAVTALSGSGPAYVFYFLEALIDGGVSMGMSPEVARKLALATLSGATQLASLSPEPLSVLRDRVTSKGGTTAAALDVLRTEDVATSIRHAMEAARVRAGELADEFAK